MIGIFSENEILTVTFHEGVLAIGADMPTAQKIGIEAGSGDMIANADGKVQYPGHGNAVRRTHRRGRKPANIFLVDGIKRVGFVLHLWSSQVAFLYIVRFSGRPRRRSLFRI